MTSPVEEIPRALAFSPKPCKEIPSKIERGGDMIKRGEAPPRGHKDEYRISPRFWLYYGISCVVLALLMVGFFVLLGIAEQPRSFSDRVSGV